MDNLFWLGRYAERTENLVRMLRAVVHRLGDDMGMETTAMDAELSRQTAFAVRPARARRPSTKPPSAMICV